MYKNERELFADLWRILLIVYDANHRVARLPHYWNSLQVYPWDEIYQAAWQHMQCPKQGRFFPKPVDFIYQIGQSRAENAWITVLDSIFRAGFYQTVDFSDPLISPVIAKLGGWGHVCQTPRIALTSLENKFKQYYQRTCCTYRPLLAAHEHTQDHAYCDHKPNTVLAEIIDHKQEVILPPIQKNTQRCSL
jgi:hypothetical protein